MQGDSWIYLHMWYCMCIIIASVLILVSGSTLAVDVLKDHEIQATFVSQENVNVGIKLAATSTNLKVESVQDEQLILIQYLKGNVQFIQVLDASFIHFQGRDYVIPKDFVPQASEIEGQEDLLLFVELLLNYTSTEFSAEYCA